MEEEKGIIYMRQEGQQTTNENKMPKTTWAFPNNRRSSICAMSKNKTSSKKCVVKS
jgi:hypothetical protein